jgi:hypothetical protein
MIAVRAGGWWIRAAMIAMLLAGPAFARDAAFVQPAGTLGADESSIKVEPKEEVDVGETTIGMPRRTTLFFVNQSASPVQIEKIELNSDGDVQAETTNDDCTKQGTIAPTSRCSIEVSVTPTSPGPWSVEVLMTHGGAGRIARAKLSGKTTGTIAEKKDMGLTLNSKEIAPVNFGDVQVGDKAIRSALMVNDSPDPITLYSIDVIEADNGLERLEEGCAVDMELKPGESCPVTLVWAPVQNGQVSTDLIIRHSGRLGFAVIPLRGKASGGTAVASESSNKGSKGDIVDVASKIPPPPSADDLAKAVAGKVAAVAVEMPKPPPELLLRLIGTIGNRAVLLLPDDSTKTVTTGDDITIDDQPVKIVAVLPKSVALMVNGKKKDLILGAAPELVAKAAAEEEKLAKTDISKTTAAPKPVTGSGTASTMPPAGMPALPSAAALPAASSTTAMKSTTSFPVVNAP